MIYAKPAGALTDAVGQYVAEKTGAKLAPGMFQAFMLVDEASELQGAVTVSNYIENQDCEISVAGETSMAFRPHCFMAVFDYVFNTLNCIRVTCVTTKSNKKARRFIESAGFVLEGRLRQGFDGVKDALIYGLLREECRFLGGLDGKEGRWFSSSSAGPVPDGASPRADEQRDGGSASEPKPDRPVHATGQ